MTVDILLPVYNGAPFVADQIGSLQAQTHRAWRLWVRDDGSTDGTPELIRSLAERDPRIRVLDGGGSRLGASQSFGWLLARAADDARYVMFCDQDDHWLPGKIETMLGAMRRAEAAEPGAPVLVHTDLAVVDAELRPVADSFWRYQAIHPDRPTLERLLVRNTVTGCAAMINRPLLELAAPIPAEAVMHDWWIAMVASCFGRILSLPTPTVLYRQHGSNAMGAEATTRGIGDVVRRALASYGNSDRLRDGIRLTAAQADAFLERYGTRLGPGERRLLARYAEIPRCGPLRRRLRVLQLRTLPEHGILRNIGMVLRA